MPTLFLSHSGTDKTGAIDLKRRLLASPDAQAAGLKVWLDVHDLDEGRPWQPQLEAAIGAASAFAVIVGTNGIRNWVRAETELALSRAIKDESFRILPILQDGGSEHLTPFVKRYHAVRDPLNNPDAMQRLLRAALGLDKDGLPVLTDAPFPGLRSMTEDWADRFFGRRTETDEVLALLRRHRAVTIVADSGAGKSSLAMAGVGHAWRGGALRTARSSADDPAIWHVVTMRPAENPIEQLRDAIQTASQQMGRDDAFIATYRDKLTTDPAFALRCGLDPAATNTLLIIDQAEELVTLTPRARRPEFGRLIAALADAMGDRLRILITLRSDHLNLVTGIEGLGPMVRSSEAQLNLKQPVDLDEIVRGPLTLAGHRDGAGQDTLIGLLRKDLSDRPGHLALAQMTLSLAWRDRGKHGGLLGAYAANGGARAALGNEAERVEGELSPEDTARLMPIFIRLIQVGDIDTGATRRIAARDEFDDDQSRLIDRLASEEFGRLVQTSTAQVEIAHESLIAQWPRLHDYLIEHARELRTLSDLMRGAQNWVAAAESAKHLTSQADEERFHTLQRVQPVWLSHVEMRFLDWSQAEHQRMKDDQETLFRRILMGVLALVVVFVGLLMVSRFAIDRYYQAAQSKADAVALLALSQAEMRPVSALRAVLGAWPKWRFGTFPVRPVAFEAISAALTQTRPHQLLQGHEGVVTSVAFSPNGLSIVSGGEDGTLRLWDATTGGALGEPLRGHEGWVLSVAFSPDGLSIVSGGEDDTLRLWDAATGSALGKPLIGSEGQVNSVAFSPDGRRIVSGGMDGTLRLWDATTGAALGEPLRGDDSWVNSVAFSSDGIQIVSGSGDGTLRVWDSSTGQATSEPLRGHTQEVSEVAFSPDGSRIISAGWDQTLRLWDATTGAPLGEPLRGHETWVTSVAFSPDGNFIVSGGGDGMLRLWHSAFEAAIGEPMVKQTGGFNSVAFSSNGRQIVSADGTLRLWDAVTGFALSSPLIENEGAVWVVAFSPDGSRLVSGGFNGTLRLWDAASGTVLGEPLRGDEGGVRSVAFSPDGRRIVSGGSDGAPRLWDAATGAALGEPLSAHGDWVNSVAFSPDGSRIVSGGSDGTLRLWDATSGVALGEPLRGHQGGVNSVAFSPDGRRIASGGDDYTLRLWDAATGAAPGEPLRGHEGEVRSIAFSPDGNRLVSGSEDGTLRLWDNATGAALGGPLRGHEGVVNSVAFSADGSRIVSAGKDGTLRQWRNLPTGNILQVACRYIPHINGHPDNSTDGLDAKIWIEDLTLPKDCDSYDPPLPPEFRQ